MAAGSTTGQGEDHQVAASPGLVHEALLYRDTGELLAGIVPFLLDGLDAGEAALVAMPGPNLDLVSAALGDAAGRVRFVDMTQAGRNPGRIIPWMLHTFIQEHAGPGRDGYAGRRVRVIGEPLWAGRTAEEYPACAQHEALINVVLARCAAAILCPYDASRLATHMLRDAWRTHPVVVGDGRRASSGDYRPDSVVGAYNEPLPEIPETAAVLDFDGTGLGGLRDAVAGHARRAGLAERRVVDLQLAVNELVTNAVIHGAGAGTVWLWTEPAGLACEVRDQGRAAAPTAQAGDTGRPGVAPRPPAPVAAGPDGLVGRVPPPPGSVGGRGLVLVNYVSDLVRIHSRPDGTAVRLYMRF